jgi:glycine/D-amino acid oxidase-like deaminating enzyme
MARVIPTQSLWMTVPLPEFPALDRDLDVDVLIVGAGVTGITTAYLLCQEGVRVALIERERIATGESGRTTAHLTHVADLRLHELVSQFGNEAARTYWLGHIAAINTIESIVEETGDAAEFVRVPGYFHSPVRRDPSTKDLDMLHRNAELARQLGFEAAFVDHIPYGDAPGVMFPNQAKFHPRRYFKGMLDVITQQRGLIFENTTYESVEENEESLQVPGDRDPQSAERQEGCADHDLAADQVAPVHHVRYRCPLARRHGAGGAVLGHARSL